MCSLLGIYRFNSLPIISIEPDGNVAVRGLDSGHRVVLVLDAVRCRRVGIYRLGVRECSVHPNEVRW